MTESSVTPEGRIVSVAPKIVGFIELIEMIGCIGIIVPLRSMSMTEFIELMGGSGS